MYDDDSPSQNQPGFAGRMELQKTGTYAATRAAIDVQISTAKAYPRSLQQVSRNLVQYCTGDDQTAESCIYSLSRGGKTIRGPSIRFAEILAASWGHLRVDARIVDEGRDFIVVRGECHDLQSNNVWAQDVTRRITNSGGKRYDADLIGVTMMAAASIAQRDSVLKCIPPFIWRPAFDACMSRIVGDVKTLNDRRIKAVGQFSMLGVTADQVFKKFGVASINEITADHLVDLLGTFNAIREGETTVEAQFGDTRITTRALGGSPLAAQEDDGKDEPAGGQQEQAPAAVEQPARPDPAPAEPAPVAQQRASDPEPARPGRKAPEAKKEEPRQRGTRRDRDADAAAATHREEPAPQPQPQPQPAPAAAPSPEPAPPNALSVGALLRFWENDCARCNTREELRALAVSYGPKFEGKLNEAEEREVGEIYGARAEEIGKEEAARSQRQAASAYEAAKNGEQPDPPPPAARPASPDPTPQPAAARPEPAPAAAPPVSTMIERCSDVAPSDPAARKIWEEIVIDLDSSKNKQEVQDRYEALEKSGKIAQLPQDDALNIRTVRFRIKNSKPA
ncbi:hypothetical protein [Methylobacterium dankookense]|uniref:Uncharacterized protein n=1 Tax=Methylobacterium dankookense TaxID=560405 RepID=A0A564G3X6_9HYPH|nr:hypothetical protein [Methylobacterium dankookense]GJD55222.1 hypothetical protein IFDJLNFL_1106 [Methylobacterium dankookense]VUF15199.1 hypothetical protein MTDSW087_04934 [Methylobacterium dankookense]